MDERALGLELVVLGPETVRKTIHITRPESTGISPGNTWCGLTVPFPDATLFHQYATCQECRSRRLNALIEAVRRA